MILLQVFLFLTPWLLFLLTSAITGTPLIEHVESMGIVWVIVSPLWGVWIAFLFYWKGKTIEVLETAKFAVNTVQENKHHAVSAFNFIKRKVKRG